VPTDTVGFLDQLNVGVGDVVEGGLAAIAACILSPVILVDDDEEIDEVGNK
jgi:hypothetical protein